MADVNNPSENGQHKPQSVYRNERQIDSLISAPLVAVSKANMMMLTGQVRFLLENCFNLEGNSRVPVMIEMVIRSGSLNLNGADNAGASITRTEMTFQMPLICLLPLNNLAVEQVKIAFGVDITSMRGGRTREERRAQKKLPGTTNETELRGRIAPGYGEKDDKKKRRHGRGTYLQVSMELKSHPLPKGTQTLLDLYTRSITPTNNSTETDTANPK